MCRCSCRRRFFSVLELLPVVAPGLPVSWSPTRWNGNQFLSIQCGDAPECPPVAYLTSVETSPCQPSTVHNALQFSMRKLNKRPAIPPVNDLPFPAFAILLPCPPFTLPFTEMFVNFLFTSLLSALLKRPAMPPA